VVVERRQVVVDERGDGQLDLL
ncbi:MAG: hypothetical protein RL190_2134, partial [Actinomycetota bacterium]